MKKYYFVLLVLLAILAGFSSCEKEESLPDGPPPTGQVEISLEGEPGEEVYFTGVFNDELGLSSISLVYEAWYLNKTIELTNTPKEYSLNYKFKIPSDAEATEHVVVIRATNTSQKSVESSVTVAVAEPVLLNYTEMWAAGSFQWWPWNAENAYRMLQDPADEQWFEILVHAWSGGYDEIKFIGQQGWNPDNWGLSGPGGAIINDESSAAIVLGTDDSAYPEYFKVRFNPYTLSYTFEEVVISEAIQSEMYIVGNGFPGYPAQDWSPENGIAMTPNPYGYGDNLFLIEGLEFSDDVSLKFIGQNTGWTPLDIGFDEAYIVDEDDATGGYQVTAPVSWMPTKSGGGTADLKFVGQAGFYTVLYDHNAKRALIWKE